MKKTGKRCGSLLLALCLAVTACAGASAATDAGGTSAGSPYVDVRESVWYAEAVYALSDKGIIGGVGGNRFVPDREVTREEFITILGRTAQKAGKELDRDRDGHYVYIELTDRDISDYARTYMDWAVINGILRGNGENLAAKKTVTRQEMAAFLLRFADYMGLSLEAAADGRDYNALADRGGAAPWAAEDMRTAYLTGLINGEKELVNGEDPETEGSSGGYLVLLRPYGQVTRAQAAQAVYNYIQRAGLELPNGNAG